MSIIDRLFPASELEALRASPFDPSVYPGVRVAAKRRKLSHHGDRQRPGSDSGYSSDEESDTIVSIGSRKRSRPSLSSTSSRDSIVSGNGNNKHNGSGSSSLTNSSLFRKYLSSLSPSEQFKYRLRTQSAPTTPQDLRDFYSHITLARSRAHSVSSPLLTPPYTPLHQPESVPEDSPSIVPHPDTPYTAGPKSALTAGLSARIFDGVRLTGNERTMLGDLLGDDLAQATHQAEFAVMNEDLHCRASPLLNSTMGCSAFAGIAMPVSDDADEDEAVQAERPPDVGLDGMKTETGVELWQCEGMGKVEDFFDLQEACDDSDSSHDGALGAKTTTS